MFESLDDETAQKEIYASLWKGIERRTKNMPAVQVVRVKESPLSSLLINVKECKNASMIQAYLQAYRGLHR